jgi:hypothetical protein
MTRTGQARTGQRAGAVRLGGGDDRRRRGGWLKWLLPLLMLAALAIALVALLGGDDDKASSGAGSAGAGSLVAGGKDLLSLPAEGLEGSVGKDAKATGVTVQSVVEGEGFWVGSSKQDRVYVEYGGAAGENEQGAFRPKVGDKVNLTGPVRPSPQDPAAALRLDEADAALVKRNGGFINADRVSRTS